MRLHPAITEEEAYTWLKSQLEDEYPTGDAGVELESALKSFAEAMAAISRTVLPDDLEPLFP